MINSLPCSSCSSPSSSQRCICAYPPLPVCGKCAIKHQLLRDGTHLLISTEDAKNIACEAVSRRTQSRKQGIDAFKQALRVTIDELDQCAEDVTKTYEKLISSVKLEAKSMHESLSRAKESIVQTSEAVVREALQYLFSEDSDIDDSFAKAILKKQVDPTASFFTWEIEPLNSAHFLRLHHTTAFHTTLNWEVIEETQTDLSVENDSVMRTVSQAEVRGYDYKRMGWSESEQLSQVLDESHGHPCCVLTEEQEVVVCGGGYYQSPSHKAYLIDCDDGRVRQLSDMVEARASHGMAYAFGGVFCFGGNSKSVLDSCEKFKLDDFTETRSWETCGQMLSPRRCFNPCLAGRSVYLCGGFDTLNSEAFDIDSETFTALSFRLPEVSDTLAVVNMQGITVITRRHFIVYRPESATTEVRKHYEWVGIAGSTNGVVSEGKVYNVSLGEVNEFDLTKGTLIRRVSG